jgi:hypothetical protein
MRIIPVNFVDQVLTAALTVTSAVSTMPITNLQSNVRDRVWRSTSAASQVISLNWGGAARDINAWGIWPGALVGCTTQLVLYSDVAYATPIYDSGAVAIPALAASYWGDYAFGDTPWAFGGRESQEPRIGYLSAVYAAKSARVTLVDVSLDQAYFEASRLWLGKYIDAPLGTIAPGMSIGWNSNSKHRRSRGGILRRNAATGRWRELRVEAYLNSEEDRYAWMDLLAACDPGNEIVVSVFPGDQTTRQERDHTIMGSLEALNPIALEDYNIHKLRLAVVES